MIGPRSVLITGASSGIGAALARAYAADGVHLALGGRDAARLDIIAEECRAAGADVTTAIFDVSDGPAAAEWLAAVDDAYPLDLVIANAGIGGGSGGGVDQRTRQVFAVNVMGVINIALPAASRMRARQGGQIAIMSSLASFRGFPGAAAYCASKAAVRVWGEALRGELAPDRVAVSVICPGFVTTPMTAGNSLPMPLLMSAERAASLIKRRLRRHPARIAFPWPMYWLTLALAALPPALTDRLARPRAR